MEYKEAFVKVLKEHMSTKPQGLMRNHSKNVLEFDKELSKLMEIAANSYDAIEEHLKKRML